MGFTVMVEAGYKNNKMTSSPASKTIDAALLFLTRLSGYCTLSEEDQVIQARWLHDFKRKLGYLYVMPSNLFWTANGLTWAIMKASSIGFRWMPR